MSIQLTLDVGNDKYIIVCNFSGPSMSGFEIIEWGLRTLIEFDKVQWSKLAYI